MVQAFFSSSNGRDARSGRWIPWLFVGGMLSVVAVNAVLIFCAVGTWGGTVSSRPYERGLDYNRVLAAAAHEAALGWSAEFRYQPDADGGTRGALVLALRDRDGVPLKGQITAVAKRPLEALTPVPIAMQDEGGGRYAGALSELPRQGVWDVQIRVVQAGSAAHFSHRIVVR